MNFKTEINAIKEKYMSQIKLLHEDAKTNKNSYEEKVIIFSFSLPKSKSNY